LQQEADFLFASQLSNSGSSSKNKEIVAADIHQNILATFFPPNFDGSQTQKSDSLEMTGESLPRSLID
jgi:hypothetical protein